MVGSETNIVGSSPVTAVFATPTLAALLSVFAREPERRYYQKELVELIGGSLFLVQRELKRLEHSGLVGRETRGRQVEYRANTHHPAFRGLRDALLNSVALGDRLKGALSAVDGVRLAFVFGSVADGKDDADSDVDLLIIGDLTLRDVSTSVVPLLRDIGREPNIVVLSEGDLRRRVGSGDGFLTDVLAGPKLWLAGDDDQLAAIVG